MREHLPDDKAARVGESEVIDGGHLEVAGGEEVLDGGVEVAARGGGGEVLDDVVGGGGEVGRYGVGRERERDGEERASEDAEEDLEVLLLLEQ